MTLIEVLVATVLLGVGVTGLLSAGVLATRNQGRIDTRTAALWLANEKLSEVDMIGPHAWSVSRPLRGSERRGPRSFNWELDIDPQTVGELFIVTVTVRWTERTGYRGKVTLETWLNDYVAAAALRAAGQAEPAAPAASTPPLAR